MNYKTIITTMSVVALFAGIFVLGCFTQKSSTASVQGVIGQDAKKSKLTALERFFDFGEISMKNGLVEKTFKVTNSTQDDITVETVVTSCMCTKAYVLAGDNVKGPFGMPSMGYVPPANEIVKKGESNAIKPIRYWFCKTKA